MFITSLNSASPSVKFSILKQLIRAHSSSWSGGGGGWGGRKEGKWLKWSTMCPAAGDVWERSTEIFTCVCPRNIPNVIFTSVYGPRENAREVLAEPIQALHQSRKKCKQGYSLTYEIERESGTSQLSVSLIFPGAVSWILHEFLCVSSSLRLLAQYRDHHNG
jgi:hypothetical protein